MKEYFASPACKKLMQRLANDLYRPMDWSKVFKVREDGYTCTKPLVGD